MKLLLFLIGWVCINPSFSQTVVESRKHGTLTFTELDHGIAEVKEGTVDKQKNSPTGSHGWLKDFIITNVTDSIHAVPKTNFGVVYQVNARDTVDIDIEIEWIYPSEVTNEKGKHFKSIRYKTRRPTNIPSASSYSLDEPYELVLGNWTMNIYIEKKPVYTKTFLLY